MRSGSRMIAEPDIPNSKKPVIPDSDRESSDIACELIPAFAGMTNVGNECIDAVGNVLALYNANSSGRGNELYYFTQDAFGNELTTSPFSGTAWSTARTIGITEHQTGKWIDPFTGLYFFHARWYDSGVGRFVGRDSRREEGASIYSIPGSNPMSFPDPSGKCYRCSGDESPSNTITPCPDPDQHPQPTPVPAPVPPPRPMPWPNCVNADGSDTYYGNWCGAGGHEWDDPIRLVYYIIHCTPVDDLDMCCFEHDFCYFIYGVNFNYGCAAKTQAEKWCDKELCNCATRSGNGPNNYKNMLMWLFCSCTE